MNRIFEIRSMKLDLDNGIFEFLKSVHMLVDQKIKVSKSTLQLPPSIFNSSGFTIVEVLVVALILGVIGYMLSDIVARSLQGSQKTAVIGTSKQNGQVVLDSVAQVIRNSDAVVCVGNTIPLPSGSSSGDNIVLYSQDGRYVRFRLDTVGGNTTIVEDFPNVNVLINNNPAILKSMQSNLCSTDPALYPVSADKKILSDTNNTNGVLIEKVGSDGIFTTTKSPGSNDAVTVQFSVKPSVTGGGFENQLGGTGVVQFQETVQLR